MIDFLSKKRREEQRKEAHEKKLKESLAKKLANYKEPVVSSADDYTVLKIGGKNRRVAKQEITLTDIG